MARYYEEYRCGCVSPAGTKRDLPGYCPTHGDDRRAIHAADAADGIRQIAALKKRVQDICIICQGSGKR